MAFRKMRRFKQQLSGEECERILKEEKRGVLALVGDDGYPYAIPLNFVYDAGAKKLFFHGAAEGHKIDAIAGCPKASFCVYDKGEPTEDWSLYVKSVVVFGQMRVIEDRAETMERVRMLALKYYPTAEAVEEEIRRGGARVTCLELTVEHMTGKRVHEK